MYRLTHNHNHDNVFDNHDNIYEMKKKLVFHHNPLPNCTCIIARTWESLKESRSEITIFVGFATAKTEKFGQSQTYNVLKLAGTMNNIEDSTNYEKFGDDASKLYFSVSMDLCMEMVL